MKLIFLVFYLLAATSGYCQRQTHGNITMEAKGPADADLFDLLLFKEIAYYKIAFRGADLVGKHYSIISKEIWEGKVRKVDTIFNSQARRLRTLSVDSLRMKVIAEKTSDDKLKVLFYLPQYGMKKEFEATSSSEYRLRSLDGGLVIEPGKKFYALAYILPYQADGYKTYCEVDESGKDVESWGERFNIPHYVVFEMIFF